MMIEYILIGIIGYIAYRIIKGIYRLLFSRYKDNSFGFAGKLVYADKGRKSRSFVSKIFGLSAKPDFIYETGKNTYSLVEYKGRNKQVYPSDIAQTIASVIAARTKYNIQKAYVHTDTFRKEIPVNKPDSELYKEIEHLADLTRKIQNKEKVTECFAHYVKCQTCSMASRCER